MNRSKQLTNWQEVPATTDKTARFQQRIDITGSASTRTWLRVGDVAEHVAVWLDDKYLGESDTPYQPRVLELPTSAGNAMLSIEFLETTDIRMPDVVLVETGPVRIARHKVLCTDATAESGTLELHVELDSSDADPVWVRTVIIDDHGTAVIDDARRHPLAIGRNRLRWTETLDEPLLWQSRGAVPAPSARYRVAVTVDRYDSGGASGTGTAPGAQEVEAELELRSDRSEVTTGFRSVYRAKDRLFVNGRTQPLVFTDPLPDVPAEPRSRSLIRLDRVAQPSAYERADAAGTLLCQCLPDDPAHARQVVDLLAHHPSIVAWCHPPPRTKSMRRVRKSIDPLRLTVDRTDGTRPLLHR